MQQDRVNIRPGVSILSVLRHLNYRPWFALAEFVDNSLQSFLRNQDALRAVGTERVRVIIELSSVDGSSITVRDDAAGIHTADFDRAFRAAAVPPDRTGLSEFGMGMKSAACWFAREWRVRTSALGEPIERVVEFDINSIVQESTEELPVTVRSVSATAHHTDVTLTRLHKLPQGRTLSKIKEHLASIYRVFLRNGVLEILFDGDLLSFNEPAVLVAPLFSDSSQPPVRWYKDIDFDLGFGQRAKGFAALRETGSTSGAGFALFRRDRLIQGSGDEGYRPEAIFGRSNSFTYQRLFGELHLEGFEVSHTKDGIQWEEHEDVFLELLRDELDADPVPLLRQAQNYRVRPKPADLKAGADAAATRSADALGRDVPSVLEELSEAPPEPDPPAELPQALETSRRVIQIPLHGQQWEIVLELSADPALEHWVEICDHLIRDAGRDDASVRRVGVRVALLHPFMVQFAGADPERIEPLVLVAAAVGLAETAARDSGVRMAGTIRRNLNKLLLAAISNPAAR